MKDICLADFDFNPIMETESGTLDEYILQVEKYLEEKRFLIEEKRIIIDK